ncbi:MAG: WYL domain-containing protein [Clostridia bacterium]|nr:WYL domain-containing protein [Clostridia bacterium]
MLEPKKTLIMRIYQILEDYSDENHPLKQQDIIDKLDADYGIECERKAVGRNLSYLQEMGLDIEICGRGAYLASRRFENSELRLLIDSVLGSRHVGAQYSKQLINKLAALGGKNFEGHVKHVYSIADWGKTAGKELFLNIELIDEAIEKGKKISFDYLKVGLDKEYHKSSSRKASPYQLVLHNQRYYLVLLDEKYQNVSYLRVDKMSKMKILKEDATPLREVEGYKNGLNYSRFSSGLPYMFNDEQVTVKLKCKNFMTDELGDWFGDGYTISPLDKNHFVATVTASKQAMLYWALQYNVNVEILSPEFMRDEIKSKIADMSNMYSNQRKR